MAMIHPSGEIYRCNISATSHTLRNHDSSWSRKSAERIRFLGATLMDKGTLWTTPGTIFQTESLSLAPLRAVTPSLRRRRPHYQCKGADLLISQQPMQKLRPALAPQTSHRFNPHKPTLLRVLPLLAVAVFRTSTKRISGPNLT